MSALHPGPGLICTTCGQHDCRRAACDSPTQRHVTLDELATLQRGRIEEVQSKLVGPERSTVVTLRGRMRKMPVSARVAPAYIAALEALDRLLDALDEERRELEAANTREQLLDRDARIRDLMLRAG